MFQLSRLASEWSHFRTVKGKPVSELIFSLDLLPEQSQPELLAMLHRRQRLLPKSEISDCLAGMLHLAVGRQMVRECLSRNGSLETLSPKEMETLLQTVKEYRFTVKAVQDWSRAQVTAGGVPLKELSGETLESLCCPGLYLCGELLNIDGDCGGYNLQWAWASGMTAEKRRQAACCFRKKSPAAPKIPKLPSPQNAPIEGGTHMLRIAEIPMPLDFTEKELRRQTARRLKVPESALGEVRLYRKSVDARKKNDVHFTCTVEAQVDGEKKVLSRLRDSKIQLHSRMNTASHPVNPFPSARSSPVLARRVCLQR